MTKSRPYIEVEPTPLCRAEGVRQEVSRRLDPLVRSELGQFFTPASTASFMASMFSDRAGEVALLDAGAGIGSLSAAFVQELCSRTVRPTTISTVAYELDPALIPELKKTLRSCEELGRHVGVSTSANVANRDFIEDAVDSVRSDLFASRRALFTHALLNPPYRKIRSDSKERKLLRSVGIESTNLYAAFIALSLRLLHPGGELVAITPRSFCNGPYFRQFRKELLRTMGLRRLHVFEARDVAFEDDGVLQENVILHAVKDEQARSVVLSSSRSPDGADATFWTVPYSDVVHPSDPESFIRILTDPEERNTARRMLSLEATLEDLNLSLSTGRVIDFRAREYLRQEPEPGTVPLIYPAHFSSGYVEWPALKSRKPNGIVRSPATETLLVPPGNYVLVKRFSAKEEPRRVVAAVLDPSRLPEAPLGFENHLNYFHCNGEGLSFELAKGLALFLNSSEVDLFFRQFNGHTQVNATDLRSLRYPTHDQLVKLGARLGEALPEQDEIDRWVEEVVFAVQGECSPVARRKRAPAA